MKIAHVVSTFPPHIGGMGQVAMDECTKLAEKGHEVTVYTLRYPGRQTPLRSPLERGKGDFNNMTHFEVVHLRSVVKLGDAGWVPQLLKYLKGFDLVHLHYPFYGGAEWVWLAKIFNKQKYVVTYHMDAAPTTWFKKLVKWKYDLLLAKLILRGAEKVIAVDRGHFVKSKFGNKIPAEKVVEIPNGVDTEIFKPMDKPSLLASLPEGEKEIWGNRKVILFVGNLLPVKRLDLLIEALAIIPAHGGVGPQDGGGLAKDVVLVVVGGGYEEAKYREIVEEKAKPDLTLRPSPQGEGKRDAAPTSLRGEENRDVVPLSPQGERQRVRSVVRFIGSCVDRAKLAKYYNLATCLVVPSDAESFSLVAIEAMACGCPVVASDLPGIRSRIEDGVTGFIFKKGSKDNLVRALEKVLSLNDGVKKMMVEAGRRKVISEFGLEQHINNLNEIYNISV